MSPAKVFGIVVRVSGLSLLIYSCWYLVYGLAIVFGLPEDQPGYKIGYFLSGFLFFVLSLYLLRGAPQLVRYCYPGKDQ